jgi:predicted branched-subunit amino acid permease
MFIDLNLPIPLWISFFLTAVILFSITAYHLYYEKGYSSFLSALNMLFVTLLLPAVKVYKTRMKILSTCAIVHVFLVLFLTNWLSIYGVAIAAAITELLILIISYYYIKKLKIKRVFS